MSFAAPAALWGLLSILLLVIFSLWRQASVNVDVPSLRLWNLIPERNPPIRALRRPKWRLELLIQALAIGAVVVALAQPFVVSDQPEPRKVAFVFDTSSRLKAEGRLEALKAKARSLLETTLSGDEVALFASTPAPARVKDLDEVRALDVHVDVEPLIAAAREAAEHVILFSDRPVEGVHSVLIGSGGGNVGIVGFSVTDREIFARLVNHGSTVHLGGAGDHVLDIICVAGAVHMRVVAVF